MSKKLTASEAQLSILYTEDLLRPESWFRKADELVVAAELLEPKVRSAWKSVSSPGTSETTPHAIPGLQGVYFMLVAYAIENLWKGELARTYDQAHPNELISRLPSHLKSHDLTKLVKRIDPASGVSMYEEDLLRRLTRNSEWAGRYLVPTGPNATKAAEQFSDGNTRLVAAFGQHDIDRHKKLIGRVRGLTSQRQEGTP